MDQAFAKTKYVRVSPRKARLAAGLIRGVSVTEAEHQLAQSGQKAGELLSKTLHSAVANAEMQLGLSKENLKVIEVRVDGGPSHKRGKPRARGSRSPILKRTSHFTIVVGTEGE